MATASQPCPIIGQGFFILAGLGFRQDNWCLQQLPDRPHPIGQADSHRRGLGAVASLQTWPSDLKGGMLPNEIVVEAPLLDVHQQGMFGPLSLI